MLSSQIWGEEIGKFENETLVTTDPELGSELRPAGWMGRVARAREAVVKAREAYRADKSNKAKVSYRIIPSLGFRARF